MSFLQAPAQLTTPRQHDPVLRSFLTRSLPAKPQTAIADDLAALTAHALLTAP